MRERIRPQLFELWRAFDRVQPWGDDWWRTARLAAAVQQPYSSTWIDPTQYLPQRAQQEEQPQTAEEQERILQTILPGMLH